MSTIICDMNAGMERGFKTDCNLSEHNDYNVFFIIKVDPGGGKEERTLTFYNKKSNEDLIVVLKDDIGVKPLNNLTQPYRPTERPNICRDIEFHTDQERVLYAECDLTDDPRIAVKFRIEFADLGNVVENVHYLELTPADTKSKDFFQGTVSINLNGEGGKKPLGGGQFR